MPLNPQVLEVMVSPYGHRTSRTRNWMPGLCVQGKEVTDGLGRPKRLDGFLRHVGARHGLPDGTEGRGVEPVGIEANVADLLQPVVLDRVCSFAPARADDPLAV